MSNKTTADSHPIPTVINGIPLVDLLSTCIDACRRGCEVIRSVHCRSLTSNSTAVNATDSNENESTTTRETSDGSMILPSTLASPTQRHIAHTFKATSHDTIDPVTNAVVVDPRSALTEADEASQAVVVECLRSCWGDEMNCHGGSKPKLWIVGEEDDNDNCASLLVEGSENNPFDDMFERYGVPRPDVMPLSRDLLNNDNNNDGLQNLQQQPSQKQVPIDVSQSRHPKLDNQELIVFIDPLDGTREYIENRIHNVQCLIGITLNGVPIAGAVGLPFGSGCNNKSDDDGTDDDNVIEVAYGWVMPIQQQQQVSLDNHGSNNNQIAPAWNVLASGVKYFTATNQIMSNDSSFVSIENNGLLSGLYHCNVSSTDATEAENNEDDTLIILSGDSKKPALKMTMDCLENHVLSASTSSEQSQQQQSQHEATPKQCHHPHHSAHKYRKIISGGCGNKILYLGRRHGLIQSRIHQRQQMKQHQQQLSHINHQDDNLTNTETTLTANTPSSPPSIVGTMAISPPGSSSWDTAAPTAVLLAMNPNTSLVTDLIGRPLIYNGKQLTNSFGVVVSCGEGALGVHRDLVWRLARDESFCGVIGVDCVVDHEDKT